MPGRSGPPPASRAARTRIRPMGAACQSSSSPALLITGISAGGRRPAVDHASWKAVPRAEGPNARPRIADDRRIECGGGVYAGIDNDPVVCVKRDRRSPAPERSPLIRPTVRAADQAHPAQVTVPGADAAYLDGARGPGKHGAWGASASNPTTQAAGFAWREACSARSPGPCPGLCEANRGRSASAVDFRAIRER